MPYLHANCKAISTCLIYLDAETGIIYENFAMPNVRKGLFGIKIIRTI